MAPFVRAGESFDLCGWEVIRTDAAFDARRESVMPYSKKRVLNLTSVVVALSACAVVVVSQVNPRALPRPQWTGSWFVAASVDVFVVMLSGLLVPTLRVLVDCW